MKIDEHYTAIEVCPNTGEMMSHEDIYRNKGVCKYCGDTRMVAGDPSSIAHHKQITGRWKRYNIFEKLFMGKRNEFFRKDEEDTVMNALRGEHV